MIINKLYALPILSSLLDNNLRLSQNGVDATLTFSFCDDKEIETTIELKFSAALCFKYTSERYTEALLDAYDKVVQIDDSDWLNEMKQRDERDFKFWHPKHYAIFFEGVGLYQFIAQDFDVIETVV